MRTSDHSSAIHTLQYSGILPPDIIRRLFFVATMTTVFDLGKITDLSEDLELQPSIDYTLAAAIGDHSPEEDAKTMEIAMKDTKEAPSLWFVNFPDKESTKNHDILNEYMQSVSSYRSWSSLYWWRYVHKHYPPSSKDGPLESRNRNGYFARYGVVHMKRTPWLATQSDGNLTRTINCHTTEFHTELVNNVLKGFVQVTPHILEAVEEILRSLSHSSAETTTGSESKAIICERYEYISQTKTIKSYIRVISFAITKSISDINNAKKTERRVACTFQYNDYEANFDNRLWKEIEPDILEHQKKAARDFIKMQTVDCPP